MILVILELVLENALKKHDNYSNPAGLLFYLDQPYQSLVRAMKRQTTGNSALSLYVSNIFSQHVFAEMESCVTCRNVSSC